MHSHEIRSDAKSRNEASGAITALESIGSQDMQAFLDEMMNMKVAQKMVHE